MLDALINDYRLVISTMVIKLGKLVSIFFLFRLYIVFPSKVTHGFEMKPCQRIITFPCSAMNRIETFYPINEKSTFRVGESG